MKFIPDDFESKTPEVPWFEDASSELGIRGHATSKSIDTLKTEIKSAMSALGGGVTSFLSGKWPTNPPRYGYQINFNYGDREGKIDIAALPIRKETPSKRKQCLKQALYTVRDMLDSQFNTSVLVPGSAPLIPFMIDDKGKTLAETLSETSAIPLLSPPLEEGTDYVDGEFSEVEEE
jgi:hypothetical protein